MQRHVISGIDISDKAVSKKQDDGEEGKYEFIAKLMHAMIIISATIVTGFGKTLRMGFFCEN